MRGEGVGAVLLTAAVLLLLAWAVGSGGGAKLAAQSPRSCPPGTFLALDGFCTHLYRPAPPATPVRPAS